MKKVNKDLICLGLTVYAGAASMLGAVPDSIGQPWDFDRCLEYAYENNISLQQKQLDKASSDATLLASKAMWQPTLDFSTTQGLTNYPSPADNSDHNLYAGTYGLNASWTVFNGNIRRNQIKQDELQQQIAELGIDDYRYTLQTEILAKYLNILYAKESIEIAKQNLAVSEYQKERAEALMNSGKMSRVDYSQIESQYHTDRYSLTSAESSFASAKMELKKLLELDITTDFDIVYPDFNDEEVLAPLPEKVEVFHTACTWVPALKQYQLSSQASDYSEKIAKGGYYPQVSLNASVGSANSSAGYGNFGTQFRNNFNEQVSLTLSIPLLDNRKNKTAVTQAKIEKLNAELEIESATNTLSQTIESIYIDATNAQAQFESCSQQVKSARLTDELVNEQFRLGLINTLDLISSHNTLLNALQEQLQAKYMAILNIRLLEFYQTSQITL